MTDIKIVKLGGSIPLGEIGEWLDQMMPNPPLPEPQRWTLKSTLIEMQPDSELGMLKNQMNIEFINDDDVFMFKLVWNNNVSN